MALPRGKQLVYYYWKDTPREPDERYSYPLGLFDLCGNAPEIVMVASESAAGCAEFNVRFFVIKGGVDGTGAALSTMAPWLAGGASGEVVRVIDDLDMKKYGFRVLRSAPIRSLSL